MPKVVQISELSKLADDVRERLNNVDMAQLTTVTLSKLCYLQSSSRGWWCDLTTLQDGQVEIANRNKAEMLCLIHSEIDEAYDAIGTVDKKMPQFYGEETELADIVIRLFDYAEGWGWPVSVMFGSDTHFPSAYYYENGNRCEYENIYLDMHRAVSRTMEAERKGKDPTWHLCDLLNIVCRRGNSGQFDLPFVIIEKLRYNMNRRDHDIEHRLADGGKKF